MTKRFLPFGIAVVVAAAFGCAEQAATPVAPSPAPGQTTAAAADGLTLKASAPAPYSPANGGVSSSLTPNLVVANATLTYLGDGPTASSLNYRFVVETTAGAAVVSMLEPTTGGGYAALGITGSRVPANLLQPDTTYRWRARAELGNSIGPWSGYWTLKTPAPAAAPTGGGGPWPKTPEGVVGYAAARYPTYLTPTSTLHEREVNMAYIRDRMIEAGICGGLDLAWNLKRGVGPRSTDALLWRDAGRDRVIDIAAGFDDYRTALRLHWIEVEGPPGYDRYLPRPTCQ